MLINSLSSLKSKTLNSNLKGLSFKNFSRNYPGGYTLSFNQALSSFRDSKVKNYSNFLLTNLKKLSDFANIDDVGLKTSTVFGPILCGSDYLQYSDVDPSPFSRTGKYFEHFNYGALTISSTENENTQFSFIVLEDNRCNIIFFKNNDPYYLCSDENNNLLFVKKNKLIFDEDKINPQDFFYLFSEKTNNILLFKTNFDSNYILFKKDNQISLKKVIDDNIATYISSPFTLSKNLYINPNLNLDTSFIKYNLDNTVDKRVSFFDSSNNFILHKPLLDDNLDVLVLKNQLSLDDVFTNNNNLLSGYALSYSDRLREYTTISNDVDEEYSDDISLNYVFYNQTYSIKPGSNYITTSESLYPFKSLNINDTKFVENGSFSYLTPEYADKVYHISKNSNNKDNNQHLLCTWLSGSPMSETKVWVDRYYYPDRIEKQEALMSKPMFNDTYNDYIEQLVLNNQSYRDSVDNLKFFDKKSDLVFIANETYRYDRIQKTDFPKLSSQFNYCNSYSKTYPSNYYRSINEAGSFSISFGFLASGEDWNISSDRNSIDCGMSISKSNNLFNFTYKIYNPSTEILNTFNVQKQIKTDDINIFSFSLDSKLGYGYVFLNNEIVLEIRLSPYEYFTKQLLYGDIFYYDGKTKRDILDVYYNSELFKDLIINPYYIDPELAFTTHILNTQSDIDEITISLPSGMRNGIDNIQSINLACSSQFKSNFVNIKINNTGVDEQSKTKIKESLKNDLSRILPINTQIHNITFEDYK